MNSQSGSSGIPRRKFIEKSIKGGIALAAAPAVLGSLSSCSSTRMAGVPGSFNPRYIEKTIADDFSHVTVAHLPTPFEKLKTLPGELRLPGFYMKRDDQTGLAFGGNKTRKLEYIVADALDKRADVLITWAGVQSNWCRQTAAACKMYGIKPVLVLGKTDPRPVDIDGNLLLDEILGADVRLVEPDQDRMKIVEHIVQEEKSKGHKPYVVAVGGSRSGYDMEQPIGAMGYTQAFLEIYNDARQRKIKIKYIIHPTGSGGTQAGLVVGAKAVDPNIKVIGISVSGGKASIQKNVAAISTDLAQTLGLDFTVSPDEVVAFDDYVGEGYGKLTDETVEAIRTTAQKEGILLDPVYTGKAMAGTIDLIKKGYIRRDDNIVFIHTGGTPALFPYKKKLLDRIKDNDDLEGLFDNWPA